MQSEVRSHTKESFWYHAKGVVALLRKLQIGGEICCGLRFLSFSLRVSARLQYSWLPKLRYAGACGCTCSGEAALPHSRGVRDKRSSTMLTSGRRGFREEPSVHGLCFEEWSSSCCKSKIVAEETGFLICSACFAGRGACRWKPWSAV